jgi:hypothetical protein
MKRLLLLITLVALGAVASFAADVAGTWRATAEGQNGTMERTFVFHVDGTKLTGETTSTMLGKSTIENGKVDGDAVSFTIKAKFQDNEMELAYKGKVSGDEITLTVEVMGNTVEWHGKRVK